MIEEKRAGKNTNHAQASGSAKAGECASGDGCCGDGKGSCCSEGAGTCGHEGGCGNGWAGCFTPGHMHSWWCLIKVIVTLALIAVIFAAGVAAGVTKERVRSSFGLGDFGQSGMHSVFGMNGVRMMGGGTGATNDWGVRMMGGRMGVSDWGAGESVAIPASRVFGVITSVEGNKITLTDNSGASQVVLSQADTVIVFGPEELTLGALKAGQTVTATGSRDSNKNFTAKIIQISSVGQ